MVDFAAYTGEDVRRVIETLGQGRAGHYVFISTGQVYLVRRDCPKPAREVDYEGPLLNGPPDPRDLADWSYGIEKRKAEDVLTEAWENEGFPSTRLRLPMVNGERDHYRRVESYLYRILDGGPILLPDGGDEPTRHVYSGSVVRAIAEMLGNTAAFGLAYNLAQQETPTLRELICVMADLVGDFTEAGRDSASGDGGRGPRPLDDLAVQRGDGCRSWTRDWLARNWAFATRR